MRVRERDDFYGISISNSYEKCKERDTYTKNWANEWDTLYKSENNTSESYTNYVKINDRSSKARYFMSVDLFLNAKIYQ